MLREQIRSIARGTDRPFCVNLVLDFAQDERLEVAVEERVPWVSFSFGLRPALVTRARVGGARVLVQVASADAARAAATAGADALIVQGVEAGGHVQSVVGLLPLLAEVRRAVSLPLLAAGGIADPASARAALAAGASAVVMGTRFVASDECDAHPRYKGRLLAAEGRDTVLTGLFDVGWPAPHRVLRNSTYERWEAAGRPPPGQRPDEGESVARAYRAMRSTSRSRAPTVTRGDGDVRRPGRWDDRRRGAGSSDRGAFRCCAATDLGLPALGRTAVRGPPIRGTIRHHRRVSSMDDYLEDLEPAEKVALARARRRGLARAGRRGGHQLRRARVDLRRAPAARVQRRQGASEHFPFSPAAIDAVRERLDGFDLAKGTIRFSPDRPVPADVLADLIRARKREIVTKR